MGRNFKPARVRQTVESLLSVADRDFLKPTPPWFNVTQIIPPSSIGVRSLPVQHTKFGQQKAKRKPSTKMFRPQTIVYEEDSIRQKFFGTHPWELARPRVVLEDDGRDAFRWDWSSLKQKGRMTDGERYVKNDTMCRR
jgi:small subunit ribosomal protein S23